MAAIVHRQFLGGGLYRFAIGQSGSGLMATYTNRKIRRAGTWIFITSENGLYDPVLQRMERNDADPSPVTQQVDHIIKTVP